eukprot:NODE_3066_length_2098_cov_8.953323.p1 GENE.NODE_3066_length_2098_cov_8.953323~~NODE_3066_length_2098_cov_8.953323.p1  ORF type:complete len:573 (+),score=119.23 NODE_3066_length_2098_cov_8.953323:191-1909(+)
MKATKKRELGVKPAEEAASVPHKKRKLEEGAEQSASTASGELGAKAFRLNHDISVATDCPAPYETFDATTPELGKVLVKALKSQGYTAPTPIQAQCWPIALQGKDMIGIAETGSGKTCAFLLPALARMYERGPTPKPSRFHKEPARPRMLVVAPTRELAQQIASEANKFAPVVSARVVSVYGGVPKHEQVYELMEGADVLIACPGRLNDLCEGVPSRGLAPVVTLDSVYYLVLDEADRMLDMGFETDIRKVVEQCPNSGKPEEGGGARGPLAGTQRQTLFFTATWPKAVEKTAASLTSSSAIQVRVGRITQGDALTVATGVRHTVHVLMEHEKDAKLKAVVSSELHDGETAIVFCGTKRMCDVLTRMLQGLGNDLWCRAIHSDKDQWDRDDALARFREITAGQCHGNHAKRAILVATDVASRGLDIPGVALVIIYDFGRALKSGANGGIEAYVHRVGRTGRAGKRGHAVTLFTEEDQGSSELVSLLGAAGQEVPEALVAMVDSENAQRRARKGKNDFWKQKYGKRGGGGGGQGGQNGSGPGSSWWIGLSGGGASSGRGGRGGRGGRSGGPAV